MCDEEKPQNPTSAFSLPPHNVVVTQHLYICIKSKHILYKILVGFLLLCLFTQPKEELFLEVLMLKAFLFIFFHNNAQRKVKLKVTNPKKEKEKLIRKSITDISFSLFSVIKDNQEIFNIIYYLFPLYHLQFKHIAKKV